MKGKESKEYVAAFIPARFNSVRLPGKLLMRVGDKSILRHVYEQAKKCKLIDQITVVVDHDLLERESVRIGADTIRSQQNFTCGTDRCIAAIQHTVTADYLINIQADQPHIDPEIIDRLIEQLRSDDSTDIASLCTTTPCQDASSDVVKVSIDPSGNAIDFYREAPIGQEVFQHIGVYGFRKRAYEQIRQLESTYREDKLRLEQLRWLDHGLKIRMIKVNHQPLSVDTASDLLMLQEQYEY